MGTSADGVRFEEQYKKTLELYEALFAVKPNDLIWESLENRFNPALFTCSVTSLRRLANISVIRAIKGK